jgi:hypothetical protein
MKTDNLLGHYLFWDSMFGIIILNVIRIILKSICPAFFIKFPINYAIDIMSEFLALLILAVMIRYAINIVKLYFVAKKERDC